MGEFVSRGPKYFCSKPPRKGVEPGRIPGGERVRFVLETGERGQAEQRVDRLDDRVVVALGVGDRVDARVRRNEHERDADAARQRQAMPMWR